MSVSTLTRRFPSVRTTSKPKNNGTAGHTFAALNFIKWPIRPIILDLNPGNGKWLKNLSYRLGCDVTHDIVALCDGPPGDKFAFTTEEQDVMVSFYDVFAENFNFMEGVDIALAINLLDGRTAEQIATVLAAIKKAKPRMILWQTNENPAAFVDLWKGADYRILDVIRPALWYHNLCKWTTTDIDVRAQEGLFLCVHNTSGIYAKDRPDFACNYVLHPSRMLPPRK